jgi:hypothetical protein
MPDTPDRRPVNPDNRAYRQLRSTVTEHLDLVTWATADGVPVLLTLIDIDSGDAITLALLDSHEIREPHVLLAVTTGVAVTAHGPFNGNTAAANHAPLLAINDERIAATRPLRLHHPHHTTIAALGWVDIPEPLLAGLRPADLNTRSVTLLLLDRAAARIAAIGPYPHPAAARAWAQRTGLPAGVEPVSVPLLPTPPVPTLLTQLRP